ncbi:metallophosphoesterase family protein [Paenibacillus sp. FSL H8-0457]|uniref:metallophosphoesterase family protein n=1 Tax=Bacillales TaxID=1385 RepID=UPI0003E26C95|nr:MULTISPECIES: metallophosphoesterase family protein [Paenibacillus]ETT66221.1 metallophosphoesterase [Paenibacillus sp. FSL H8-457]MCM3258534.1 metallophosphatase family protein [Paenibacillus lautus]QOT11714.1 metallophosphoesterase family protein [Paenibacillus sp. JNUCC-32]
MAQFALISDIHGNIPALEAVLRDIQRRGIETIYCLGDLIGKGPHGDVAVDMVRTHCQQVIKGNWDDFIGNETDDPSLLWHQHRLGSERLQYLAGLPYVIEFMMSGKWVRLFHASPRSVYERIQPWDDQEKRATLFHSSPLCGSPRIADVAGYGDIHNAYHQHLDGRTLFNTGSVGNPLEMPEASYVVLEGVYGSEDPAPLNIQCIRVPYPIEQAVQDALESGMPHPESYILEIRTGRYQARKD